MSKKRLSKCPECGNHPYDGHKKGCPLTRGGVRIWKVVRQGRSPMNPKVRWAQLECGHDVYVYPGKRIGKVMVCEKCSAMNDEQFAAKVEEVVAKSNGAGTVTGQ